MLRIRDVIIVVCCLANIVSQLPWNRVCSMVTVDIILAGKYKFLHHCNKLEI